MKSYIIPLIILLITGCTYYHAPPTVNKFDQAWSAASGAFNDQGVNITTQNRDAGVLQGTIDGAEVKITLLSQANGSVKVEFDTSGKTQHDQTVLQRIATSYNRRMGR